MFLRIISWTIPAGPDGDPLPVSSLSNQATERALKTIVMADAATLMSCLSNQATELA